ncbi:uncharacterized protein LOC110346383 [Heterocephalus glaber]|uniref:Uncharacterized protein LOC110346383 n=1 Tax=Heterocephalus glaber TaxID=10181 RepID=A0AAX6S281_HETGA|nr:uncharacterized protein LOC110346383 [Heterocephalus glaber]
MAATGRAAGRERALEPGAGALLFLIQWRVVGPAAASGGALGSGSRSAPGRGRRRGLHPHDSATGAEPGAPSPGRRDTPRRGPLLAHAGGGPGHQRGVFDPESCLARGQLRGAQHKDWELFKKKKPKSGHFPGLGGKGRCTNPQGLKPICATHFVLRDSLDLSRFPHPQARLEQTCKSQFQMCLMEMQGAVWHRARNSALLLSSTSPKYSQPGLFGIYSHQFAIFYVAPV